MTLVHETVMPSCFSPSTPASGPAHDKRWAVVLAGGDGKRLLPMTRVIAGDDRPKQFCALVGADSLLEKTRKRAERSVPAEQILFALTASHRPFYLRESGIRPSQRIVQPSNKGTAPPIVYSLMSIAQQNDQALVAILPSDHHYSDENGFTSALETAFESVQRHSGSVVLLGSEPRDAQTEYGWIEPGEPLPAQGLSRYRVRRFCEKPSPDAARFLFDRKALWNTFVMVGRVCDFLALVGAARTGLLRAFPSGHLWSGAEVNVQDWIYNRIAQSDFSRDILATQPDRLSVMHMGDIGWNDLGHPERVADVLQSVGLQPWWIKEWHALRRPAGVAAALPRTQAAVA